MATDTRSISIGNLTDAQFRNWGQGVSDAIQAVGIVKLTAVEAAGQINWATVTRAPLTPDNIWGYEVFRFNDALQASAPVFFKVFYGSGGSSSSRAKIVIQVGTGCNSAGTLTGVVSDTFYISSADWDGNTPPTLNEFIYTSGASNRIQQIVGVDHVHGNYPFAWSITRTKDSSGNDTGDGVVVQAYGASAYVQGSTYTDSGISMQQVLLFTGIQADTPARNIYSGGPVVAAGNASLKSGVVGADIAVFPWLCPSSRGYENLAISFASFWSPDITNNTNVAVRLYGADHTFKTFGNTNVFPTMYQDDYSTTELLTRAGTAAGGSPAGIGTGLAMRWE